MGTIKKNMAFSNRQIPAPPVTSFLTLGKWPNFSEFCEPVFSFVNGGNTYLIGLL